MPEEKASETNRIIMYPNDATESGPRVLGTRVMDAIGYNIFSSNIPSNIADNPDPVIWLRGSRGLALYEEMLLDPNISSPVNTRFNAVLNADWEMVPAGKNLEDVTRQEFAEDCIESLNSTVWSSGNYISGFNALLNGIMDGMVKGYSCIETIWNLEEGRIAETLHHIPQAFVWKSEEGNQWSTQWTGHNLYYYPQPNVEPLPVPPFKFITAIFNPKYGNPHGNSILQPAYWPYLFSFVEVMKMYLNYLDAWSQPFLVYLASSTEWNNQVQMDKILTVLSNLQSSYRAVLPRDPEGKENIKVIEAGRGGASSSNIYEGFMDMMNRWKTMAILGQVLATMEAEHDTRAAAAVQHKTKHQYFGADCAWIADIINNQFLQPQIDMKFGKSPQGKVGYPKFQFKIAPDEDLNKKAERYDILRHFVRIGEQHVLEQFGLPAYNEKTDHLINQDDGQGEKFETSKAAGKKELSVKKQARNERRPKSDSLTAV